MNLMCNFFNPTIFVVLTHRVTRALLAHTVGVAFNLRLGRSPLDLDNLLID